MDMIYACPLDGVDVCMQLCISNMKLYIQYMHVHVHSHGAADNWDS